ncbi:hypothetical protein QIS99_30125 [Streptomyces sp. B-S-A8]|uniref:Serine/threonine protein kinase n=1 Tax=Streptomyces solicavernae TaxID=3043614 RepID=A0ABT6S176_9ACTN|nr:hypothetical protein [Streptomyces sp. B-S-A8]MDI3390418.1 hypothetical protein [Streptomyces sp. B-S-A8]
MAASAEKNGVWGCGEVPTAIAVTSADLVLPPPDLQTPPAAVLGPGGKDHPLERTLAELQALLDQHGYVVVLYPASLADRTVHRLHTARALLESDRIALLRLDLPPLGLAMLALQLRQLALCDFSPGVLASAARLLSHYIYAGALLGSVAKLDRVPVSLTSHAKSWVPGSQFAVLATPEPQLVKVSSGAGGHAPDLFQGPGFGTQLLIARGQLNSDWVTAHLAPAWKVQGVAEAPLPAESGRWWATGRLVEFAAAIPDITMLYQLVSSVRREDCHWCGLDLIGDRCGFCAAPLLPREQRTRTHKEAGRELAAAAEAGAGAGAWAAGAARVLAPGPDRSRRAIGP